ncbi:MAG: glycosyltransferase family 39 protein [Peptococcaceae bacterium]|nr:glycosyltransferase family 39 protein [Peptococcaceae bacterium]
MKKQEKILLFFLLFIIAAVRLYHIGAPPLEIEESWRQADTESMAWNFANYDRNPFHPNLNYDGPLPNIPALEIQVTTYVISILYRLFGHHYFFARLVPLTFFIISGLFLYLFARNHMGKGAAAIGLAVYGLLPINVYYSRAIMPESAALMFWIAGFYFFEKWVIHKKNCHQEKRYLITSSIFLAFAIMTKPPVIVIAVPMLFLCFRHFKWGWAKFPELWGYVLATLGVPAVYYYLSGRIAEFKFTVGITHSLIVQNDLFTLKTWQFFSDNIPRTLGLIGLLLVLIGVFSITKKEIIILVWFAAMLFEVIVFVGLIRSAYYLIFFAVPCSLLIGNLLYRMLSEPTGKILAVLLIFVMTLESLYQVKPMFKLNSVMQNQVEVVQRATNPDDLLVVGALEPCLLSLADRRGWRYNLRIYEETPVDPRQELAGYIEKGAKYFVPIQGKIYGDESGQLMRSIEERYTKIEPVQGYPIFQLQ